MKTCVEATRELKALCELRGVDWKQYPEVSLSQLTDMVGERGDALGVQHQ